MAPRTQIPVLILTGFLGSGKTTLLSQWLRAPEFAGAMAIVNELGEVGLDDRLVQHSSDVPLLLENGCACCEAAEDLNATLERLFWQRLHRQIPKFSWVLIETTGVADPGPLLASLAGHQLVSERYCVRGVVTTFDARRGPAQLPAHAECRNQIARADAVILTKTDIASAADQAVAFEAITGVKPGVRILSSARASLTAAEIVAAIGMLPGARTAQEHVHEHAQEHSHEHAHGHAHDHAHSHPSHSGTHAAHHAGEYTTAFAPLPAPLDWRQLAEALAALHEVYGSDLLRLKGTARTGANGAIDTIQAIAGESFERAALAQSPDAKPVRTGITIIARHMPAHEMARDLLLRLGLPEDSLTDHPVSPTAEGARAHV
ncbi:MAG: GTP-binding protein [Beijerinckiaceae bacterium]